MMIRPEGPRVPPADAVPLAWPSLAQPSVA
jgi:hypothetical protein